MVRGVDGTRDDARRTDPGLGAAVFAARSQRGLQKRAQERKPTVVAATECSTQQPPIAYAMHDGSKVVEVYS